MAESNVSTKVAFFLVGAGVGAVVALLFAPKSGEETRRLIADKAGEGKDYLTAKGRDLGRQAGEYADRGKEAFNRQKERLADALEAGKEKVRSTLA